MTEADRRLSTDGNDSGTRLRNHDFFEKKERNLDPLSFRKEVRQVAKERIHPAGTTGIRGRGPNRDAGLIRKKKESHLDLNASWRLGRTPNKWSEEKAQDVLS